MKGVHGPYRVWIDGDEVRVARDRPVGKNGALVAEHLTQENEYLHLKWEYHNEGAHIPRIEKLAFVNWVMSEK